MRAASFLLDQKAVNRSFFQVGRADFEFDLVSQPEFLFGFLAHQAIIFLVQDIIIVAQVSDFHHSFGSGIFFFDINAPLGDAGDCPVKNLADFVLHKFNLFIFLGR